MIRIGMQVVCAKCKGKVIPLQVWTGPGESQEFEVPRFQNNRHVKVLSLSAIVTGRLYPPVNIPGTRFC